MASLALQLTEKVQQLRDFGNSFRGAPAQVKEIVKDLDLFCEITEHCAKLQHDEFRTLEKVLIRCGDKIGDLERFTERLEHGFASRSSIKRHWTSFKAVLGKDVLKKFQNSLRDTKLDSSIVSGPVNWSVFHILRGHTTILIGSGHRSDTLLMVMLIELRPISLPNHLICGKELIDIPPRTQRL